MAAKEVRFSAEAREKMLRGMDKRTHEALREARQNLSVIATMLRQVEKAGDYGQITTQL